MNPILLTQTQPIHIRQRFGIETLPPLGDNRRKFLLTHTLPVHLAMLPLLFFGHTMCRGIPFRRQLNVNVFEWAGMFGGIVEGGVVRFGCYVERGLEDVVSFEAEEDGVGGVGGGDFGFEGGWFVFAAFRG